MNCKWDIETELTEAPDGRYLITTEMFDYRKEQSPDYVFETWTSDVIVTVENGKINKQEALKAERATQHRARRHTPRDHRTATSGATCRRL